MNGMTSVNVIAGSIDCGRFFMRSALLLIGALIASSRGFGAETATSGCEVRAIRSQEVLVGAASAPRQVG
jgi:hypothetical protein